MKSLRVLIPLFLLIVGCGGGGQSRGTVASESVTAELRIGWAARSREVVGPASAGYAVAEFKLTGMDPVTVSAMRPSNEASVSIISVPGAKVGPGSVTIRFTTSREASAPVVAIASGAVNVEENGSISDFVTTEGQIGRVTVLERQKVAVGSRERIAVEIRNLEGQVMAIPPDAVKLRVEAGSGEAQADGAYLRGNRRGIVDVAAVVDGVASGGMPVLISIAPAVHVVTPFAGDIYTRIRDLSADGTTAVGFSAVYWRKALIWTREKGSSAVAGLEGFQSSEAVGTSGDGSVVVGNAFGADGSNRPWMVGGDGTLTALPTLGKSSIKVLAISDDSRVILGADGGDILVWSDKGKILSAGKVNSWQAPGDPANLTPSGDSIVAHQGGYRLSPFAPRTNTLFQETYAASDGLLMQLGRAEGPRGVSFGAFWTPDRGIVQITQQGRPICMSADKTLILIDNPYYGNFSGALYSMKSGLWPFDQLWPRLVVKPGQTVQDVLRPIMTNRGNHGGGISDDKMTVALSYGEVGFDSSAGTAAIVDHPDLASL